jgi:hypothetical protein
MLILTVPQLISYICTVVTIKQLIFNHSYDKTPLLLPFCVNTHILTCWVMIDFILITIFIGHVYSSWPHFTDHCHTNVLSHVPSSGGRSSASGLKSLQGGDHLTPTSYSDRWLWPVLPSAASSRAGLTSNCQNLNSAVNFQLVLQSESESDLFYDWRSTVNHCLGANPLEVHDQRLFLQLNPCGHSLTRELVCLLWISFDIFKCTYRTHSMLTGIFSLHYIQVFL